MNKEEIFSIVEEQGLKLKLLDSNENSYVILIVEGDANSGDYITEYTSFEFQELKLALFIQEKLNEMPAHFQGKDFEMGGEFEGKSYNLYNYIAHNGQKCVHSIVSVALKICINGQLYKASKL
jgi:hypothetical protein